LARTTKDSKIADYLSFSDRRRAILIRQVLFNVNYLLNRGCALYLDHDDLLEPERRLYQIRTGRTMAGSFRDTLYDLFIAHPDLATEGYESFDWSKAKRNRDAEISTR
jgi:hypothetical protein